MFVGLCPSGLKLSNFVHFFNDSILTLGIRDQAMFWGLCLRKDIAKYRIFGSPLSFPWTHHGIAWMILISFLPSYVSINLSWSICVFSCNFSVKSNRGSGSRAFPTFTTSQLAKFIAIQTHIHHLTKLNYCITRTFLVMG